MKKFLLAALALWFPVAGGCATLTVAADAFISSSNRSTNFGNGTTLNIGGGNSALIRLDLSALPANLAPGDIQKATMMLFVSKVSTPGSLDVAQVTGSTNGP